MIHQALPYNVYLGLINATSPSAVNPYVTTSALAAGYVPYTGAVSNLNLGLFSISAATAQVGAGINSGRALEIFQDTANLKIGSLIGTTSQWAFYGNQATPSATNYIFAGTSAQTRINASSDILIRILDATKINIDSLTTSFLQGTATTGAVTTYTFTKPNNTGQTSSTAIPGWLFTTGSRQWLAGNIALQEEFKITSPTYSFVAPSTIAEAVTLSVAAPTIGGNATFTNTFAALLTAGTGTVKIGNLTGSTTQTALYLNKSTPSGTNYTLRDDAAGNTFLNGGQVFLGINGTSQFILDGTSVAFQSFNAATSGTKTSYTFNSANHTGQTASTAISGWVYNSFTRTWANGGSATTIATQIENDWRAVTYATSGGGSLAFTNIYGNYFNAPILSGVTAINNYAAGFNGPIHVISGTSLYGGIISISRGLDANAANLNINAGSANTSAFQIGTDQPNLKSIINGRNNYSLSFQANDVERMLLSTSALTFAESINIVVGSTTGSKIGTATTQKIGFWNATPIVQPTTAVTAATYAAVGGTTVQTNDTFDGYTVGQIVKALRNEGLLA